MTIPLTLDVGDFPDIVRHNMGNNRHGPCAPALLAWSYVSQEASRCWWTGHKYAGQGGGLLKTEAILGHRNMEFYIT